MAIDTHIAAGDVEGLTRLALLLLGVLVLSYLFEAVQTHALQVTGQRIIFDLRMQIHAHLQRLDVAFFDRNPVGRLMTRVTTDVDALNDLFASGVVSVFRDVFMLTGIAIVLFVMDWRLAIVALSVLPLIAAVTQWFRRHARQSYREVRGWIARINAFLQENVTGMATVQLFRREARQYERFDDINRACRDAHLASIFFYAVFYPAVEVLGALAVASIIWFGGAWTLQGSLELGSLVAFVLYSQALLPPDQRFVREVQRPAGGDGVVRAESSGCSTPRWRSPTPPRRPPRCGSACGMTGEITAVRSRTLRPRPPRRGGGCGMAGQITARRSRTPPFRPPRCGSACGMTTAITAIRLPPAPRRPLRGGSAWGMTTAITAIGSSPPSPRPPRRGEAATSGSSTSGSRIAATSTCLRT